MLDPFILNALIAGIGVALMCGPLGCFVAWQRMAYFGDTIAHAALLGIVCAMLVGIDFTLGIMMVALIISALVYRMERQKTHASDTLLGIFSHGALALGLVLLSLSSVSIEISGLLFGDILAVSGRDIIMIYAMAAIIGLLLLTHWRDFMRLTLHSDIAKVEGIRAERLKLTLMLCIAASVAVSIKIVGILLITSMLIIPAAAMRAFSRTPTQMALLSIVAGIMAVSTGLYASLQFDTPSGASIILAALGIFLVAGFFRRLGNFF